jgi:hypothetical protein
MDLHSHDSMKGYFGGEQDAASHARTDVDEGKVANRCDWFRSPPSIEKCAKDRGSDAIVGRGVAIVRMSALQVPAGDKPARTDAIRHIERVTHESIRHGESGEEAALACGGHDCTVAHASRSRTNQLSTQEFGSPVRAGINPSPRSLSGRHRDKFSELPLT